LKEAEEEEQLRKEEEVDFRKVYSGEFEQLCKEMDFIDDRRKQEMAPMKRQWNRVE
jgi:hypothetical protein